MPLLCSNLVSPRSTQIRPSRPICMANRLFQPIWATFWPTLGHIWGILGLANGPNWSAWVSSVLFQPCSNLVPTCSNKSYGIKAYLDYFVIFGPTLACSGPLSSKWTKLVSLNVLSAVPTMFQPVPLKGFAYSERPWSFFWMKRRLQHLFGVCLFPNIFTNWALWAELV